MRLLIGGLTSIEFFNDICQKRSFNAFQIKSIFISDAVLDSNHNARVGVHATRSSQCLWPSLVNSRAQ